MAEEVKKVITVEVGKSITSVRDFKKHIEDLRGALLGLNEESEEYKTIAEQIATDQAKLNEVMKVGKDNTDAASGSYNALNNQLKSLRQQYKALSETERNGATGQAILQNITKLDTELKDIDQSMGQYQRNVGNYKQAFEGAFRTISSEISKINPTLGAVLSAVEKLVPAFKGVGTAAKGAGTSIKSAMASTGIGLLVVALSEIVQHWEEISNWARKVLGLQQNITTETQKSATAAKSYADEMDKALQKFEKMLAASGATKDEIYNQLIGLAKVEKELNTGNINSASGLLQDLRTSINNFTNAGSSRNITKMEDEVIKLGSLINNFTTISKTWGVEVEDVMKNVAKGISGSTNITRATYTKFAEELNKQLSSAISQLQQNKTDIDDKIQGYEESYKELTKSESTAAKKAAEEVGLTEEQIRRKRYEEDKKAAEQRHKAGLLSEKEYQEHLKNIEIVFNDDIKKIRQKAWESSEAYQKLQQDLKDKEEVVKRLEKYGKDELTIVQENFEREKELIIQYEKDAANLVPKLAKEYTDKRHEIISEMVFETQEELTKAYEQEIEIRKEYGLEYTDLEEELQERINKIYQDAADKRIERARFEMQRQMQVLNDATTQALHDVSLMWTKNTGPNTKWNFWNYMFGKGQDNESKISEQLDTIFGLQEQQLQAQIQIYEQYQGKLIEGSQEYIDIERQKTETIMELDNLRFEHAVELNDREVRMQEEKRRAIQTIMSNTVSIYSSFTDMMLVNEEQGSNKWKAFKTSEAIVNMLSGILAAFMSGFNSGLPAPWNIALAASTAGVAAAAGAAQIAQIQSTKMGSTSSANNAITGGGASSVSVSPLLNPDYDLQRITNLSLQSDAYLPGNTQVYVLESDIQEVGNRVQVREQNATF